MTSSPGNEVQGRASGVQGTKLSCYSPLSLEVLFLSFFVFFPFFFLILGVGSIILFVRNFAKMTPKKYN
jgi:hypothetical protein